jgi:hypothetical protein
MLKPLKEYTSILPKTNQYGMFGHRKEDWNICDAAL